MAGRASKWDGVIVVDGKKVSVFLDGKGSAFDEENNEYQWQERAGKWVRTRRPHVSIYQFVENEKRQTEALSVANAILTTFGL